MPNNTNNFTYTNTNEKNGRKNCVIGGKKLRIQLSRLLGTIVTRCYNPKHKYYSNYGGRGITVCDEWRGKNGLDNFYKWAIANGFNGEKDNKGYNILSIDRIDNTKGYCPENCRWSTRKQQANNKSTTIWVEYKSEKNTLKYFCEKLGLDYHAVFLRIYRRNWSIEKALSTPIQKNLQIEYFGEILELNTIARLNDIKPTSLKYQWIKNNYNIYKAIEHFRGAKDETRIY